MKINSKIKYIIFFLIILIIIIYIFKPFRFEEILRRQIVYSNITNLKINKLIDAYSSNDYLVDDIKQITEIYNKLSNLKVRRCIFYPKVYEIQPNKTYIITMHSIDKVVLISINTDSRTQYITVNNRTYKIITSKENVNDDGNILDFEM